IVAFIGAFTTQNDFPTLLALAERLRSRPDVLVVLVGGGAQESLVTARLAQGDLPNLRWLGWLEYEQLPGAWAAADVCLLALRDHPLYAGTVPAKYFEAMASGVPIAAAANGVAADLAHTSGAGFAVPAGDVDGLARIVERLLDDAAVYASAADAGRAYAEAHFDPARVTAAYEALLMQAMRR
ncbi:MAG: glycosyltransferase, partial [Armatimonadetes bacterium]|nr:glycosyltransferase [Anaerolineae bacterium]